MREVNDGQEPVDNSVLYIIIDGEINPHYDVVSRRLAPIANRTIKTMVKASALSSLYKMFLHAGISGYDFKYVSLPMTYEPYDDTPYDPEEMRRMFRIGSKMGMDENSWLSTPLEF